MESTMENGENVEVVKKSSMLGGLIFGFIVVVLVGVFALAGVFYYRIYYKNLTGPKTLKMISVLQLPAAKVNGSKISLSEFYENVTATQKDLKDQPEVSFKAEEIPQITMDRLVRLKILEEEARKLAVTVSQKEADDAFAALATRAGGVEAVAKLLSDRYGWSVEKFMKKSIFPEVMRQKVVTALEAKYSVEMDAQAKTRINEALAKVKAGGDFGALAKEYSDDPGSGPNGGELGFFGPGMMVPEFEKAAFATPVGQISGVVKTQFGYHIIKVEEVKKVKGKVSEVRAAHILVSASKPDSILDADLKAAKVVKYIKFVK